MCIRVNVHHLGVEEFITRGVESSHVFFGFGTSGLRSYGLRVYRVQGFADCWLGGFSFTCRFMSLNSRHCSENS